MKSNAAYITVVYKYITIFLRIWGGESLFNCHNAKNRRNFCHAKYNFLYWSCNVGVKCEQDMFFHEIHPFAVSFTITFAAYQGKRGAVFWDLHRGISSWTNGHPCDKIQAMGIKTYTVFTVGLYGPLHIERDRSVTAKKKKEKKKDFFLVQKDVTGALCKPQLISLKFPLSKDFKR